MTPSERREALESLRGIIDAELFKLAEEEAEHLPSLLQRRPRAENLIMRARSLEKSDSVAHFPNYKPVAGVRDMAFVVALPFADQGMHPVPSAQLVDGGGGSVRLSV